MEAQAPKQKRPHRLLRGLLTAWLASWLIIITLFLKAQLSTPSLFPWSVAAGWLGIMVLGWVLVFYLLRRLQKLPPE